LSEAEGRPYIKRALEAGINFFDTADVYSNGASEEVLGRALREIGVDRHDVVIATKCNGGTHQGARNRFGLSRKNVIESCDASLKRLNTDFIDLYQIHRYDPRTPIEETIDALNDLVRAGKVRYLGASSMWAWQFAKMQHAAERYGWARFVSMQNHYNLVYREEEREMIPLCRDQGVGLLPWSPLARGFLAGNRGRDDRSAGATARARTDDIALTLYYDDADFAVLDSVKALAQERRVSNATLAYAWLLSRPGVTAPIVGASQVWQLEEAIQALDVALTREQSAALEKPYRPHAVLGHT
jgi:aryl-alcohol dehydrogenase (NADP+)